MQNEHTTNSAGRLDTTTSTNPASSVSTQSTGQPAVKKFKYLEQRLSTVAASGNNGNDHDHEITKMETELNKYISDCSVYGGDSEEGGAVASLSFWFAREKSFPRLAPLAEDIVSAPASEAYCERECLVFAET